MKNTVSPEDAAYDIARAACEDACEEHGANLAQIEEIINDYTGHLPAEVSDTDASQSLYEGTYEAAESLIRERQQPTKNEYGRRTENGEMLYWEQ